MFSNRIKEFRVKNNLTQQEFSRMIGVSSQAVSNWENNEDIPSGKILLRIALHYNLSVDYLLDLKTNNDLIFEGLPDEIVKCVELLISLIRKYLKSDGKNN